MNPTSVFFSQFKHKRGEKIHTNNKISMRSLKWECVTLCFSVHDGYEWRQEETPGPPAGWRDAAGWSSIGSLNKSINQSIASFLKLKSLCEAQQQQYMYNKRNHCSRTVVRSTNYSHCHSKWYDSLKYPMSNIHNITKTIWKKCKYMQTRLAAVLTSFTVVNSGITCIKKVLLSGDLKELI